MKNQIRRLRREVIFLWCVLLVTLCTAAAGNIHLLYLSNANNQPSSPVSLAGANWTGTLAAARLPASVPLLDGSGNLALTGTLKAGASGGSIDTGNGGGYIDTSGYGGSIDTTGGGSITTSDSIATGSGGYIITGSGGCIVTGGSIDTGNGGGYISTNGGSCIDTSNSGGGIQTNGYGAPTDTTAPIGSLYCDQDPAGTSGHVLWVKEATGWAGK